MLKGNGNGIRTFKAKLLSVCTYTYMSNNCLYTGFLGFWL